MSERSTADLLFELGCEELPPKSLSRLSEVFFEGVCEGLAADGFEFDRASSKAMQTPRRIAVLISGVTGRQPDRSLERRGPAVSAAYDESGKPTRAALGFAASVGRELADLETMMTDKGEWLFCRIDTPGKTLQERIFPILKKALDSLPVDKPMRWSSHEFSFVRPVHWLMVLHGEDVLSGELFGQHSARLTRGHRVHSPGPHEVYSPGSYESVLGDARVLVDPASRRTRISELAMKAGKRLGGVTRITENLLDEVCNLVEWPVAVACKFDTEFLEVPQEALVASMEDHQKFFPVLDPENGRLIPVFVAISNIESTDARAVQSGYERVIRPRLADARFFWEQDKKRPLEDSIPSLDDIVFQEKMGSVGDKSRRMAEFSKNIAEILDFDPEQAKRAALLCKCDLVSQMVGEFPELQGTMGAYYARASGEDPPVCEAIGEHYAPRYAGDALPGSRCGQIVSLADRFDTLAGIFSIGLQPSGNKDPFALRRAALGVVRILIEKEIPIPIDRLLAISANALSGQATVAPESLVQVRNFILDRARSYFLEKGFSTKLINAVLAAPLNTLPDLNSRLLALNEFMKLPEAAPLVAANKRIGNILRKAEVRIHGDIDENSLHIDEERLLFTEVMGLESSLGPMFDASEYGPALRALAGLQTVVANFFDHVMVMDDNPDIRKNRLALLGRLKGLFDHVADLSKAA